MYRARHAKKHGRSQWLALSIAAATALAIAIPALASHGDASLTGSNFEIDTDANLTVEHVSPPSLDWANVSETRAQDTASGATDESFGQGTKENTAEPTVVDGSIPPNKSDLKFFGVYEENDEFLHLFWSRVQDPEGTTNMDFELNKLSCSGGADPDCSANGITPLRTAGDILFTYDLSKGGTTPVLRFREWTGTVWGPEQELSAAGDASGSINTSTILAGASDGLGQQDPRTFGEASIRLDAISDPTECLSFGSAYLKSRASDSFTAALKDFVPPSEVEIGARCGAIKVTKDRKHAADGAGNHPHAGVDFTVTGNGVNLSGTTDGNGEICFGDLFFGTYTVTEETLAGYATNPPQQVEVTDESTCGDGFEEVAAFHNIPLTNFTVSVDSQIVGGTASTITCGAVTVSTGPGGDGSLTRNNLEPGIYTCTIDIDP